MRSGRAEETNIMLFGVFYLCSRFCVLRRFCNAEVSRGDRGFLCLFVCPRRRSIVPVPQKFFRKKEG